MTLKWFNFWSPKTVAARDLGELDQIRATLARLETKVDEALLGLEVLRRRQSVYVGEKVALTYLVDDSPIYVNSLDFGGPANLLNGGEYEADNLDVLLSFVRDDTVFLDIGANLGFFALMIARRVHRHGKVHAFEPNPEMTCLLKASAYINGFAGLDESDAARIIVHNCGAGDADAQAEFWVPPYHTGGGVQAKGAPQPDATKFVAQIRRLDDLFAPDFRCNLVKIDVEGHEMEVLRGMKRLIARSPDIKILFEKLSLDAGSENELEAFFEAAGFNLYGVKPGALLVRLLSGELAKFSGYVLAAPDDPTLDHSIRRHFRIYPRQLHTIPETMKTLSPTTLCAAGTATQLLFHGPYWRLRAGVYRIDLIGKITGEISFSVATRFGLVYWTTILSGKNPIMTVVIDRDLIYFECIVRAAAPFAEITLGAIDITRLG